MTLRSKNDNSYAAVILNTVMLAEDSSSPFIRRGDKMRRVVWRTDGASRSKRVTEKVMPERDVTVTS